MLSVKSLYLLLMTVNLIMLYADLFVDASIIIERVNKESPQDKMMTFEAITTQETHSFVVQIMVKKIKAVAVVVLLLAAVVVLNYLLNLHVHLLHKPYDQMKLKKYFLIMCGNHFQKVLNKLLRSMCKTKKEEMALVNNENFKLFRR